MKKFLFTALLGVMTLAAHAQFKQGTKYMGASLTGIGFSYNKSEKATFGLETTAGYFFTDNWMLRGNFDYTHRNSLNSVALGALARYSFEENGISLGAGLEFNHYFSSENDLSIPVEIGYTWFLNKKLTIEPAVYYKMSLCDFSDKSTVGLRIGLGYYF